MRLFIAIELIDRVKDELSMIQKRIKLQGMKGNFTIRLSVSCGHGCGIHFSNAIRQG